LSLLSTGTGGNEHFLIGLSVHLRVKEMLFVMNCRDLKGIDLVPYLMVKDPHYKSKGRAEK